MLCTNVETLFLYHRHYEGAIVQDITVLEHETSSPISITIICVLNPSAFACTLPKWLLEFVPKC